MSNLQPSDGPGNPPGSARSVAGSLRELAVVAAVATALIVGLIAWAGRPKGGGGSAIRGPSYVGESACRPCHPGESARHARSGHAKTLRPASERADLIRSLEGKDWADPEFPGTSFRYSYREGRAGAERIAPGTAERLALEYAFGSGQHATTFVTMTDADPAHPAAIEHRLTHYTQDGQLRITPGQDFESIDPARQTTGGRVLDARLAKKCFDCHSTRLSDRDEETLDVATLIPNVSCERCHGPGSAHVESVRLGARVRPMPFGPGRYSDKELMDLCGRCHRLPDRVRPGSIRPENAELVRFQPVGLMASKCYKASEGAIGCTTCHDPHARPSDDRKGYEAACLECHRAAPQAVCKVSPAEGCIGCHMPRRDAGQRVLYADHWIRVHDAPGAARPTPR